MASIDEELQQDVEDDAREVAYFRAHLPKPLQEKWTDDILYYFLDTLTEYYATSGVLDATPGADGYIEIDGREAADYVVSKAQEEGMGSFDPHEVLEVVRLEMDYSA